MNIHKNIKNLNADTKRQKQDKIEKFCNALIQHGQLSNRIYLMKLKHAEPGQLIRALDELANEKGYTKIFAKVPARKADIFLQSGYRKEADIPGFYHGQEKAMFLARYLNSERKISALKKNTEKVLDLALQKNNQKSKEKSVAKKTAIRQCKPDDAERISEIYKTVFQTYPFPITNPEYITKTMTENIVYFGVEMEGQLVSLASSEMDVDSKNVELTDFATLPEFRGNSFAGRLLRRMEKEMKTRNILTAYTIARAVSPGMNITFSKAGYDYRGTLINNTNISGQIESMNVWYKHLA